MATQDPDTQVPDTQVPDSQDPYTQEQDTQEQVSQDATQNTQPHDKPNSERIQVRVAFDVAKGDEKKRYWEFLDITFPDTYQKFCSELRWLYWRVQSTRQEKWGWTIPPSVFWTDMPCQTTMNMDNWARALRFIRQRERGDYIRLDLKYESLSAQRTWMVAPKAKEGDRRPPNPTMRFRRDLAEDPLRGEK